MKEPVIEVEGLRIPAGEADYYDRADHLWARVEGPTRVRVGLSEFGQKAAGAVAYVKIKSAGKPAQKGRAFGSIEAGKYIGPLKAPATGTIAEVNGEVLAQPGLVNSDPYGRGWFVVIEAEDALRDLRDLVHGEAAIRVWIEAEHKRYVDEGLFGEKTEK